MIPILYTVLLVQSVPARRGVSRYHTGEERRVVGGDYYFARKVRDPCGGERESCESVTKEEVINMVDTVAGRIEEIKTEMVRISIRHCSLTFEKILTFKKIFHHYFNCFVFSKSNL